MEGRIMVDSAATLGTMSRRANGKMRHMRVGSLWIQQKVEEGELGLGKVNGPDNPADLMPKYLGKAAIEKHIRNLSQEVVSGRAGSSLRV